MEWSMLQLLARAPLFSREESILATSVPLPLVSAKLVAVSFFYRVFNVAILELLNFFHFETELLNYFPTHFGLAVNLIVSLSFSFCQLNFFLL
jgi:hypothetical protein